MKKAIVMLAIIACTIAMATPSFATWSVTASRHNFGSTNTWGTYRTTSTPNVCVFCHTPHAAQNYSTVNAPLWNRQTVINREKGGGFTATYSMYSSPTLDTSGTMGSRPDGVSLACLSCHDGTVSLDALVNIPPSDKFMNPNTSARISRGWSFSRSANVDGDGLIANGPVTGGMREWANTLENNDSNKRFIPFLGSNSGGSNHPADTADLRDDHPISMRYAGQIEGSSALDPKFRDAKITKSKWAAAVWNPNISSYTVTGTGNTLTDGDIRLFANNDSMYKVQCASCHNPHGTIDGSVGGGNTAYPTFLQRPMVGSELCLICHIK